MRTVIVIIFTFLMVTAFGQTSCDSVSKTTIITFENYSLAKLEKIRKSKRTDAETLFNAAEFLRHKGDTLYKSCYLNYINKVNSEFKAFRPGPETGLIYILK
jgi:hypothetical protein